MSNFDQISDYVFELAVLKKLPRSGAFVAGIKNPDTVAEHVFRAAQIACILAEMEGGDGERAAFITLFHDNGEARVGDHHRIMDRYINGDKGEAKAFDDQCLLLPKKISTKISKAFAEYQNKQTIEGRCAKDADYLELAFQSKEYVEQGFSGKKQWLEAIEKALITKSAKLIFASMMQKTSNDWWQDLKYYPKNNHNT